MIYYDEPNKPNRWKLFQKSILDSLSAAGPNNSKINAWAYIVPNTEPDNASLPYKNDYDTWAQELAGLSLEHDNLVAFAIDDFDSPLGLTSSQTQNMINLKNTINPNLAFIPCVYYLYDRLLFDNDKLSEYLPYIDGVLFAYYFNMNIDNQNSIGGTDGHNLWNTTNFNEQVSIIKNKIQNKPIIPLVYATGYYSTGINFLIDVSTPEYVLEIGQKALDYADGVYIYQLQTQSADLSYRDLLYKYKREVTKSLFTNNKISKENSQRVYVF